tara:strand:+ start:1470 stop:1841 length:372 start_codon:yes stop_codon:yes gene_type:complete
VGFFSATDVSVESIQNDFAEVLLADETVLSAFRTIRDTVFLTNLRFVKVDVQGLTGKKVDITSVPWKSVTRFSVETAGSFDLDADLKVWVSSAHEPYEVKISKKSDAAAIQRIFAQQILAPKG